MTRTERLFELLQLLRKRRSPISAAELGELLGVSIRTIYRDIDALRGIGAEIEGEAGLGYLLRPGHSLPPLMFTEEEIHALKIGLEWVSERTDLALSRAAERAASKITAVLPPTRRMEMLHDALWIIPFPDLVEDPSMPIIRRALRDERKLRLSYRDESGAETERVVWPIALAYFETTRVFAAWCELRGAIRHFRTDRIGRVQLLEEYSPRRREELFSEWRQEQRERRY